MIRSILTSGAAALALAFAGPTFAASDTAQSKEDKAETQMQQTGSQSGSQTGASGSETMGAGQADSETETWRDTEAQAGSTRVRPLSRDQAGADIGEESPAAREDAQVGEGSDLAGERYGDLRGRQMYSREGTEIGRVEGATMDERGEIDGFIVAGGPALGPHLLFIPIDIVRPAEGSAQDLQADVGEQDVERSMQEWQDSGQQGTDGKTGDSDTQ
jgi:hypothetical protein